MEFFSSQGMPYFIYAAIWISIVIEGYLLFRRRSTKLPDDKGPPLVSLFLLGILALLIGIFAIGPLASRFFNFSSIYFVILFFGTLSVQILTIYRGAGRGLIWTILILVCFGASLQFFHVTHRRIICLYETRKDATSFELIDQFGDAIPIFSFSAGPYELSQVAEKMVIEVEADLGEKFASDGGRDFSSVLSEFQSLFDRLYAGEAFRSAPDEERAAAVSRLLENFIKGGKINPEHWARLRGAADILTKFATDLREIEGNPHTESGWTLREIRGAYPTLVLLSKSFPATESNLKLLDRVVGVRSFGLMRPQPFYSPAEAGITGGWILRPRF